MLHTLRKWILVFINTFLVCCYRVVSKAHVAWLKPSKREASPRFHGDTFNAGLKGDYDDRPQRGLYYDVEEGSLRPMRRLFVGVSAGDAFGRRGDEAFASDGYYVGRYGQLICDESFGLIAQLGGGAFSTVWLALDVKGVTNSAMSPMVLSYRSDSTRYNSSSVVMAPGRAFVVLKISRSLPSYCRACEREFETHQELYVRLQRAGFNLSKLLIHSMLLHEEAPRSSHVVQVGDPCGPSLLEFVMNCNPKKGVKNHKWRLRFIKQITRYVAEGLAQLHLCGIVHTDVKPENVLLRLPSPQVLQLMKRGISGSGNEIDTFVKADKEAILSRYRFEMINNQEIWEDLRNGRGECDRELFSAIEDTDIIAMVADLKIADLGNAVLLERVEDKPTVSVSVGGGSPSPLLHVAAAAHAFQTREYRAPEICLGITPLRKALSGSMDVWSLGCMVFELITGRYLLNPRSSLKQMGVTLSPSTPPSQQVSSPTLITVGNRSASSIAEEEINLAHLAMIQEVCGGPPPPSLTKSCGFDHFPQLASDTLVGRNLIEYLIYQGLFEDSRPPKDLVPELTLAVDWLTAILQWDPATRPTMQDLLAHPWLSSTP